MVCFYGQIMLNLCLLKAASSGLFETESLVSRRFSLSLRLHGLDAFFEVTVTILGTSKNMGKYQEPLICKMEKYGK